MNYERFSQLWDALVTHRPAGGNAAPITNGMTADTAAALVDYANGNKAKFEAVRTFLKSVPSS
jgi:hypothetical protein